MKNTIIINLFYLQINHYYFKRLNNAIFCYVCSEKGWGSVEHFLIYSFSECLHCNMKRIFAFLKYSFVEITTLFGAYHWYQAQCLNNLEYTLNLPACVPILITWYYKISQIVSFERTIVKEFSLHNFQFSTQFLSTYR